VRRTGERARPRRNAGAEADARDSGIRVSSHRGTGLGSLDAEGSESGALLAKQYLITDRDTKYTEAFRRLLSDSGTAVIRLPPRSPNLNAYAERFVRSVKDECLNRMIFVGQGSLHHALTQYREHYHMERNH
jgi:transposase InsO family protein